MSGPQTPELRCYKQSSTRPPVPGEERNNLISRCQSSSPDNHNRRHRTCDAGKSISSDGRRHRVTSTNVSTMEENVSTTSSSGKMACLDWSRNLHALLEDQRGLELFEKYLSSESSEICDEQIYVVYLWYACEGLKEEKDLSKLDQSVKVIIKKVCQRPQLGLPKELREKMMLALKQGLKDKDSFDKVREMVEQIIERTIYPHFLSSEVYLGYVRYCQSEQSDDNCKDFTDTRLENASNFGGDDKGSLSSPDEPFPSSASSLLPTLHEDNELHQEHHHLHTHKKHQSTTTTTAKGEMRLTKDMLMATQQIRALDVRPKPEAFAGLYLRPGTSPYHAPMQKRAQYSSYNPVSRQDSELQSLSSDARTESDNLSLTDVSMSDSASVVGVRHSSRRQMKQFQSIKKMAQMNRDPDGHEGIIPRTQWISEGQTQPLTPTEFAEILIKKLEKIKRDQENSAELSRKLTQIESSVSHSENLTHDSYSQPRHGLNDAFKEKLQLEDDNDQAILDQHVSRVWSDPTPSRSPKVASPRPFSPDKCRRGQPQQQSTQSSNLYLSHPQTVDEVSLVGYRKKKPTDVFSTFSGDSGNVHDFPGSMNSLVSHLPKSKSMPSDYADYQQNLYPQGQDQRYRNRLGDPNRPSSIKKSMTELTDSGVSVVSKDSRPMSYAKSDQSSSISATHVSTSVGSGSSMSKLTSICKKGLPMQPFVGDPGMPLLPRPHTPTQLEEAKRRLFELPDVSRNSNRNKQRNLGGSSEHMSSSMQTSMPSNQSTMKRTKQDVSDFTTVVFSFCEEKVPYRTKISGNNVTLKQFKDVLPKKGNYRYFFKTECEDLDMQVIQEEVTDDTEVLPLWEGKIMAQVKALE